MLDPQRLVRIDPITGRLDDPRTHASDCRCMPCHLLVYYGLRRLAWPTRHDEVRKPAAASAHATLREEP